MTIDEFQKSELRVGTVIAAEPMEGSEKLLKLQVDIGEAEPRQILSGIAKAYSPADLVGKQVVIIANLDPRKMMGLESNGMLLAAHGEDGAPVLVMPASNVPAGSKYHKILTMNKNVLLGVYVVLAAAIIGFGSWYVNTLTQPSATTTTQVEQSSIQNSTSTTNNMDTLKIVDTTVGTGTEAKEGDTVTVNYTGTFDDGTKFDSSLNPGRTPFSFTLGAQMVIAGWDQGVLGMKVGGTRELTVPPSLGYGPNDYGPIPGNSTLHFTITLLSVSSTNQ